MGTLPGVTAGGNPDYVNTCRMEDHAWFVGDMDREGANVALMRYPPGTYLVRRRANANGEGFAGFALSLRTEGDVKHMKICSAEAGGGVSPTNSLNMQSWNESRQSSSGSNNSRLVFLGAARGKKSHIFYYCNGRLE